MKKYAFNLGWYSFAAVCGFGLGYFTRKSEYYQGRIDAFKEINKAIVEGVEQMRENLAKLDSINKKEEED